MQTELKTEFDTKKTELRSILAEYAETWLKRFSEKHGNETDEEFREWLER